MADKIGANGNAAFKAPGTHCVDIIGLGQTAALDRIGSLPGRAQWRDQMGQHQMSDAGSLCEAAQIGGSGLTVIDRRRETGCPIRSHHRVDH